MPKPPEFDVEAAHKYFAAYCFNSAWDLIEKKARSEEDNRMMVLLNQASLWHWTNRPDRTDQNLSIGYWQAARIYALLGKADMARYYGNLSLHYSHDSPPFFKAYAYEALARAEAVAGNSVKRDDYLKQAYNLAEAVEDEESEKILLADLKTI